MHTMNVLTDHMMGFITSCSFECITHWKCLKINAGYNTLPSFVFQLLGFYMDIFYYNKNIINLEYIYTNKYLN